MGIEQSTFASPEAWENAIRLTGNTAAKEPGSMNWTHVVSGIGGGGEIDLGDRKVILLVDGDLTINNTINLTRGLGFFLAIAAGDIIVSETIGDPAYPPVVTPHLEGMFLAFDDFVVESTNNDDDLQIRILLNCLNRALHIRFRRMVAAHRVQRDPHWFSPRLHLPEYDPDSSRT